MSAAEELTHFEYNQTHEKHRDYRCLVKLLRDEDMSHRCGYVVLPKGHPAEGKGYCDDIFDSIEVHGGLTFAGTFNDLIRNGLQDWVVGFDCNHSTDAPDLEGHPCPSEWLLGYSEMLESKHVWTFDEVVAETKNLCEQLAELGGGSR